MFYREAVLIFGAWLLFVLTVRTDFSEATPRLGWQISLRGLIAMTTVAAILLGAAAILTRLSK
jgi:hypothetical protein